MKIKQAKAYCKNSTLVSFFRLDITNPQSDFITEFIGINNFTGKVVWREGMAFLQVERNLLPVQTEMPDGTIVSLKFFPSQIEIVSDSTPSAWQGRVEEVMNLGDRVQLVLSVGDNLFAKIEIPIPCRYRVGDRVEFIVKGSVSPAGGDDKGNNQSG